MAPKSTGGKEPRPLPNPIKNPTNSLSGGSIDSPQESESDMNGNSPNMLALSHGGKTGPLISVQAPAPPSTSSAIPSQSAGPSRTAARSFANRGRGSGRRKRSAKATEFCPVKKVKYVIFKFASLFLQFLFLNIFHKFNCCLLPIKM